MRMADRLAEQIEYDYDRQMEKCRKKIRTEDKDDDIGEDAMVLHVKRGKRKKNSGDGKEGGEDGNIELHNNR